jgi:hypothetical protein
MLILQPSESLGLYDRLPWGRVLDHGPDGRPSVLGPQVLEEPLVIVLASIGHHVRNASLAVRDHPDVGLEFLPHLTRRAMIDHPRAQAAVLGAQEHAEPAAAVVVDSQVQGHVAAPTDADRPECARVFWCWVRRPRQQV